MKKKILTAVIILLAMVLLGVQCTMDAGQLENRQTVPRNTSGEDGGETVDNWEHLLDEKQYWQGNIEDDFDGSTVLVVLDRNTGGINKEHNIEFFGGIEIEYIEDLMYIEGDVNDTLLNVANFR